VKQPAVEQYSFALYLLSVNFLPHAQTAIYDSKVKLFLKQGISRQLGRG
jgi:hypothetical protein